MQLSVTGRCHREVKHRIVNEGINCDHIPFGLNSNKGRKFHSTKKIPLESVLVENSYYDRKTLKKRLLQLGLLENKCYECGQLPLWNNKKLVMVLDHKNGVNNDNRLDNLRMLCPNCNSQMPTFSGRNLIP